VHVQRKLAEIMAFEWPVADIGAVFRDFGSEEDAILGGMQL